MSSILQVVDDIAAHNEYEIGNWRASRHRLSHETYVQNYKRNFPVSEPKEEWDARNLLYSLRYDLATAINFPESNLRQRQEFNCTNEWFCH